MTTILALRHAPTAWNAASRIQGRTDEPLDIAGRATAARWRIPAGWEAAACLASPLARAMGTAALMSLAPTPEIRLIEMDWGEWEGRTLADLRDALGPAMAANEARGLDFRPAGGESPREVQARLAPLLAEIVEPTVFVTHKGVIRALLALATGWTMNGPSPQRLRDGCAHLFSLGSGGTPSILRLNVALIQDSNA